MKICFECDGNATEEHHIIPKSLGGKRTIPLCASCHAKAHGIQDSGRADLTPELTKRGQDKFGLRPFELYMVFQSVELYEASTLKEIQKICIENFEHKMSVNQISRLRRRVYEMDKTYRTEFFNNHFGKEDSYVWDDKALDIQYKIKIDVISEFKKRGLYSEDSIIEPEVVNKMLFKEVQIRFNNEINKHNS